MKFNRKHIEELTLQKIKEVNDEAGYRKYLEVPEMVNIIATIIESSDQYREMKDEIENDFLQLSAKFYKNIMGNFDMEDQEKVLKLHEEQHINANNHLIDCTNTINEQIKELETYKKIIKDTLRALPVGNINTHTPDSIPERVQDWVKEAAEECSLREKWEELADKLIVFAEIVREVEGNATRNTEYYNSACEAIEQYEKLKDANR